jgi:hypothetical protein
MMQKDMVLAMELGRQLDVPLPTTAVSNEFLTAARGMGWTKYDFACMFDVLAAMSGVTTPVTAGGKEVTTATSKPNAGSSTTTKKKVAARLPADGAHSHCSKSR